MKAKPKRIVYVADLHTGSECALRVNPESKTQNKLKDAWGETIEAFGPEPDLLVLDGDANDGQDKKGASIRDDDVPWQIEEAEQLVMLWRPKAVAIVEGSAYHTGDTVQHEKFLAGYIARNGVPCRFHTKLRGRVNGWWRFQARHFIGASVLPYGIFTAPARSQTGQVLNAALEAREHNKAPAWPHLSVFAHAHVYGYAESAQGSVVRLPCWKAIGDRYGDTKCDGHVDIGAFQVRVGATEKEGWQWERRLYSPRLESRTVEF